MYIYTFLTHIYISWSKFLLLTVNNKKKRFKFLF